MVHTQSPPFAEKEWLTGEDITSGGRPRRLDARFDQRVGTRPEKASIHSLYSFGRKDKGVAGDRPSIGRRTLRSVTRFFIAVFIGVGATLACQSYGDAAREMVVARVPILAWWLPVPGTKPPVVASTSPASVQQFESLTSNLDVVRRSLEQLAAKQEQMARNVATLQAVEEDVRQKMSYTPPSPSQQAVSIPQQKPPQSRARSPSTPHPQPTGALPPSR